MNRLTTSKRTEIIRCLVEGNKHPLHGAHHVLIRRSGGTDVDEQLGDLFRQRPAFLPSLVSCTPPVSQISPAPSGAARAFGMLFGLDAVEEAFGDDIDYVVLQKLYDTSPTAQTRYSLAKCIRVRSEDVTGNPDPRHVARATSSAKLHHADGHAPLHRAHQRPFKDAGQP